MNILVNNFNRKPNAMQSLHRVLPFELGVVNHATKSINVRASSSYKSTFRKRSMMLSAFMEMYSNGFMYFRQTEERLSRVLELVLIGRRFLRRPWTRYSRGAIRNGMTSKRRPSNSHYGEHREKMRTRGVTREAHCDNSCTFARAWSLTKARRKTRARGFLRKCTEWPEKIKALALSDKQRSCLIRSARIIAVCSGR